MRSKAKSSKTRADRTLCNGLISKCAGGKKYYLLTISLIIVSLILGFGETAYQKALSKPINTVPVAPVNQQETDKENSDTQNNVSDEQNKGLALENAQPGDTANASPTQKMVIPAVSEPAPEISPLPQSSKTVYLAVAGFNKFKVNWQEGENGWEIMKRAARENNFYLGYEDFGWGIWIKQIGNICEHDNYYWALYHNGQYSQKGISDLYPQSGDLIEWRMETW